MTRWKPCTELATVCAVVPMHRLLTGLRGRIAVAFSATCIVVIGGFGLLLYGASHELDEKLITQILVSEMHFLEERFRVGIKEPPPPGPTFQYYIGHDGPSRALIPAAMLKQSAGRSDLFAGEEHRDLMVVDVGAARLIVAYDAGEHERRMLDFKQLLMVSLLVVAGIAMVLGYGISGLLTRQLSALAARVAALEPDQPATSLQQPGQSLELVTLAAALDQYQARSVALMQREREFTANASHEFRTPLTAIATTCEMLELDASLSPQVGIRIRQIQAAARRMNEQIRTLLFLARNQKPGAEMVNLQDCIEQLSYPYREAVVAKGLTLQINVPADASLPLHRQAFEIVYTNLLRNAIQYSLSGVISVTFVDGQLVVEDSGEGIDAEDLPHVFDRHFRSVRSDANAAGAQSEGLGLGLAIVRRICESCSWHSTVTSAPGCGARFSVHLNPHRRGNAHEHGGHYSRLHNRDMYSTVKQMA